MDEYDGDPYFRISPPKEEIPIEVLTQYVYNVIDFSTQYGHDRTISYAACNVVGTPSIYPKFGDSPRAFLMRSYGKWWSMLPSSNFVKFYTVPPSDFPFPSEDFLEVKFDDRVYPTEINIYETYNPGAVVKIFGYSYETLSWEILWQGEPEWHSSDTARIFNVKLNPVSFKTNCIRLEFHHQHLQYFYEVDAISLVGTSIPLHEGDNPGHGTSFSLFGDFFKLGISSSEENAMDTQKQSDFEKLPNEIIQLIFSYLDLKSLCSASGVSRWFKKLCYDSVLYKVLNLQPYWSKVDDSTLFILQERCGSLQCLNLSWCGNRHRMHPKSFMMFAESTCSYLTCLKLSNCGFVNNLVLKTTAKTCQYLQVLELRSCHNQDLNHIGFSHISLIKSLVYLDLYRTAIEKYSLILIIKSCSKLEHLFLGSCMNILQYNDIVQEIGKYLSNLKTLDLWRARSLTEVGVFVLAEHCHDLVELDLGWCIQINANSGCVRELVKNCPKLKKLFLTAIRTISDSDFIAITNHGKELEQLDVLGTREISLAAIYRCLETCNHLKLLDLSFCENINEATYLMLRAKFPHVDIKRLRNAFPD